jgi:hypothetical protein
MPNNLYLLQNNVYIGKTDAFSLCLSLIDFIEL